MPYSVVVNRNIIYNTHNNIFVISRKYKRQVVFMWYEGLFEELESMRNPEYAARMASYMRNQFPFLGIQTGQRREAYKLYLAKAKKEKIVDFDFVEKCFAKEER
jgi:hypothetical protein